MVIRVINVSFDPVLGGHEMRISYKDRPCKVSENVRKVGGMSYRIGELLQTTIFD